MCSVPKQVKILLQSIAGKNVKKTDAILDVPTWYVRVRSMAGGNKSRALMAELADRVGSSPIKRI